MESSYLEPTYFIDSDHPSVQELAHSIESPSFDLQKIAIDLYYKVRDSYRYNPYKIAVGKADFKASAVIQRGYGYCVTKALLLVAVWRARKIPARPGFADVRNHLSSPRLTEAMGTDVFYYHGYAEAYLNGKWVKATPAFDARLCKRAKVLPLEFDGKHDSIFQPLNAEGKRHMEYLRDHGAYADLPYEEMLKVYHEKYPDVSIFQRGLEGQFEKEAIA